MSLSYTSIHKNIHDSAIQKKNFDLIKKILVEDARP